MIIRETRYTQARNIVRREALLVDEMSYPLAELDTCRGVAILHRDAPEDVREVELDLKVSVVWHRKTTENSGIACAVYVTGAAALLGCCQRPVLTVDLAGYQPADLSTASPATQTYGQGLLLRACRIP
jgi:hypothetical protein